MTIDQMWQRLAQHQPYADARGYGPEWAEMCETRTPEAANAAADAAWKAAAAAWKAAAWEAWAAADAAWNAADAAAEADAVRVAWAAWKAVEWIEKAEGLNGQKIN